MFDDHNSIEIPHINQLMLSDPGEVDQWFQGLKISDHMDNQRKNKNLIDMLPKNITDLEDDRYLVDTDLIQSKNIIYDSSLKNLQKQPHEYLKKFNNLVNKMSQDKSNDKQTSHRQLNICSLTKFRLPKYFLPTQSFNKELHDSQEMTSLLIINKSERQDKFLKKHHDLVDKTMKNITLHKKWVKNKDEVAKKTFQDNQIGIFKMEQEILSQSSPTKQRLMMTACSPYMLKHINKQSQGYQQYQVMKLMLKEKTAVLQPQNTLKTSRLSKQLSQDNYKSIFDTPIQTPKNFRSPLIQRKSQTVRNLNGLKKLQKMVSENEIKEIKEMVLKQPHIILNRFFIGENGLKKYKDFIHTQNEQCIYNYGDYIKKHFEFPTQIFQVSEPTKQSILNYHARIEKLM